MSPAFQSTGEPAVLLAGGRCEAIRLLAIVLEGFGYAPLECQNEDEALEQLGNHSPAAALVYLGLEGATSICSLIERRGGVPLLALVDAQQSDPDGLCRSVGADQWERLDASPEQILVKLRSILVDRSPGADALS